MTYTVNGTFHEACDCEVICPCWAEVAPPMGECTAVFAWSLGAGSEVDGIVVAGGLVVMLTYGTSCDDASHVQILIGGFGDDPDLAAKQAALARAVGTSPWSAVVKAHPGTIEVITGAAITLDAAHLTVRYTSSGPLAKTVEVDANWVFDTGTTLHGTKPRNLVLRATGRTNGSVEVGRITVPKNGMTGLNLLSETVSAGGRAYLFDLDVTQVTAMRGTFHYTG